MSIWSSFLAEIRDDKTIEISIAAFGLLVLTRLVRAGLPERRTSSLVLFAIYLVLVPVAATLRAFESSLYREVRLAALVFATLALIGLSLALIFAALPRVRVNVPRILQDVVVAISALVAIFMLASRAGLNLSGLIATSAVLTAVIGLAFQDTLGNVVGGLTLQMDDSLHVGDWIQVGDVVGRVTEIRWRYTAVETRDWETVILPNGPLAKGQIKVLGRRTGAALKWRRWVYFNVDFRYPPNKVIRIVLDALRAARIPEVADEPRPDCIIKDLQESYCRYGVRYWLTNLAVDDPTDSVIRTRIYFALRRAGIPLSIPAHAVFLTEDSAKRKEEKGRADIERRLDALARVELFSALSEEERTELAQHLRYAPFAPGETMTRQGAEAHWLYMIIEGDVSVRVATDGLEREVARLHAGDFFGEMSLLTGERRTATVQALTPVECYRLDKAGFQGLIAVRPEIAELMADVLARRKSELSAAQEHADDASEQLRVTRTDLLSKIRNFFALDEDP